MSSLAGLWDLVHGHPILREGFGLVGSLAMVVAALRWERVLASRGGTRLLLWSRLLTVIAAAWTLFAFRRIAYGPTALFVSIVALVLAARMHPRAKARVADDDRRGALGRRQRDRTGLFWAILVTVPFFWGKGSLFGDGWQFNVIAPVFAHALAFFARDVFGRERGKHRFRFSSAHGRTVEAQAVYLAVTFATQFLIYLSWSRIPGEYHVPRVVLWAAVGALAATVADLYLPDDRAHLTVPLITAAAMYVYVAA